MKKEELLSKTITCLRFPLTVGVVFIHFNLAQNGFMVQGVKYGLNNPYWYYHIINFFSDVISRIAVPLFFFISGFLFFYKKDFNWTIYKQKVRTRFSTLVLPFFLWNSIAILIVASRKLPLLSPFFPNAYKIDILISPLRLYHTFFANYNNEGIFVFPIAEISKYPYPIDGPLWYVRELILLVFLSPVIYFLIKKMRLFFITILGIIWYFLQLPDSGYPILFITAAFFFSFGAYFSINKMNFVDYMRKGKYIPLVYLVIAAIDTFTKYTNYNPFINKAGILVGLISAVVVMSYLVEMKKVRVNMTLANSSFFVFALHTLIMGLIGKAVFTFFRIPDNTFSMLFMYFLIPIITIALCVCLYVLLNKYFHNMCDILTGGRT